MTRYYLDTSAAAKLVVQEVESDALAEWADGPEVELVATLLLETELRRVAHRLGIAQEAATAILDRVTLHQLPPSLFHEAGILPGTSLRSLDALHLASAIRLGVRGIVTYDDRLAEAALAVGLTVFTPGSRA